jgi:maltooligosyltrehalose trehalohydrolase
MEGERLSKLVSFEGLKLAAGVLLLSPYIPLLFMGEEYGERSPFYYFVSHSDPLLLDAVRKGRREEFSGFSGNPPDPGVEQTFLDSKLHWETRDTGNHRYLLDLYRQLLRWRRELPCLSSGDSENTLVYALENEMVVLMHRWKGAYRLLCIFNFNRSDVQLKPSLPEGEWIRKLDSSDTGWNGPGSLLPEKLKGDESVTLRGHSFAVFSMEKAADD